INERLSHLHILKTCLAYLLQFDGVIVLHKGNLQTFPLAKYAAKHWIFHAGLGDIEASITGQQMMVELFQQQNAFLAWVQLWDLDKHKYICWSWYFGRDAHTLPLTNHDLIWVDIKTFSLSLSRRLKVRTLHTTLITPRLHSFNSITRYIDSIYYRSRVD